MVPRNRSDDTVRSSSNHVKNNLLGNSTLIPLLALHSNQLDIVQDGGKNKHHGFRPYTRRNV